MDIVLEEAARSGKRRTEPKELNAFSGLTGGQQVKNQLKGLIASGYAGKKKDKDKSDRSVVEKVIGPKTERLFEKWIKNGVIRTINGCVSSGKEANVYHAVAGDGKDLALKIYKVDTMVFRDREEYITGEHRFKRGYVRSNAHKLIKVWAEKEFRNLRRIKEVGILCPEAYLVKENLILMEFLGKDGDAAPRLKDAPLNLEGEAQRYIDTILMMRALWCDCKLVHGDLSAYNMLWHQNKIALIDVSQSVEESHPQAIEFLKRDLLNISRYFRKLGVQVGDLDRVFDLIREKRENTTTSVSIPSGSVSNSEITTQTLRTSPADPQTLAKLAAIQAQAPKISEEDWEILADRFISQEVLRGLHEIAPEEVDAEFERIQKGGKAKYAGLLGAVGDATTAAEEDSDEEDDDEVSEDEVAADPTQNAPHADAGVVHRDDDSDSEVDDDSDEEDADEEESSEDSLALEEYKARAALQNPEELEKIVEAAVLSGTVEILKGIESVAMKKRDKFVPTDEKDLNKRRADDFEGMSKEERKKLVKEEKREQRAHKIPKKEKKKLTKKTKY